MAFQNIALWRICLKERDFVNFELKNLFFQKSSWIFVNRHQGILQSSVVALYFGHHFLAFVEEANLLKAYPREDHLRDDLRLET